jgi:hypothetical protein
MKKVSSLLTAVFLMGVMYAQEKKDTVPYVSNQPSIGAKDTIPVLLKDTMPSWRRDTIDWNKDSLKRKNLNDTLGVPNNFDSLNNAKRNANDSLRSSGNNVNRQDTSGIVSKTSTWKDTSAMSTNKKKLEDTSGVVIDDKTKLKDNKEKVSKNDADTTPIVKTKKVVKDRVMMKDGEMVIIQKGKETKMLKNIKLPDGNIVMTDGTVKMPDGNSVKLKDGEYINLSPKGSKGI